MNDVFDEDLMKELGLNADDVASTPKPGNAAPKRPAPAQTPPSGTQPAGSAPKPAPRPAPRPPVGSSAAGGPPPHAATQQPQERPVQQRPPAEQRSNPPEIDVESHARRMTEDLPVQMAAVLAKKSIALKDVIDMRVGEVIDFKKVPQDPIDLVANGKLIAKAEMVLVDGKLGVKIVKLVK